MRTDSPRSRTGRGPLAAMVLLVLLGAAAGGYYLYREAHAGLPSPGSDTYEQTVRRFEVGLIDLQIGLVDAAIDAFGEATTLAPGEPAGWANLGLSHLRVGDFEAATTALDEAARLAPGSSAVAFMQARLETIGGNRDEGLAALQRAIDLDPDNLQARMALVQEVENAGAPDADEQAQALLEDLVTRLPDNRAVLVERARLAAKREDAERLRDSVARLRAFAGDWPSQAVELLDAAGTAADAGTFTDAARSVAFLRNVLVQVPAFLEDRTRVTPSTVLIASALQEFLRLPVPVSIPAPRDAGLTFEVRAFGDGATAGPSSSRALLLASLDGDALPVAFAADADMIRRLDDAAVSLPFPGNGPEGPRPPGPEALVALDWNHDFRMDLAAAGVGGVRLFLQDQDAGFVDATTAAGESDVAAAAATAIWAADLDMDGDEDLVVARPAGIPDVLRNNGDGTWTSQRPFAGITGGRSFAWADVDADGDPDVVVIDEAGDLRVFANLQAGRFAEVPAPPGAANLMAAAVGDVDADGRFDVVTLARDGRITRAWLDAGTWQTAAWAAWPDAATSGPDGTARVVLGDLDNNGAVDLVASGDPGTAVWLADERGDLQPLDDVPAARVTAAVDLDGDGRLDLAGLDAGAPVRLMAGGTLDYHYVVVRPRAQIAMGDQRISSFGVGGDVEVRAGPFFQQRTIDGPVVHVGLGTHTNVDAIRIVWPNGVPQAEFEPGIDQVVVADQRLKGSCPWVFADDGTGLHFVTDFLWRSPLGLRINAQDTAGVTQTEDWVRIDGRQLAARDGAYDVRITAELWETHFVDHVSLLVVDHPADIDVFVDERFSSASAPDLKVRAVRAPVPVAKAWDQTGRDVTDLVATEDGRYLDTFAHAAWQGIAEDHFVEIELADPVPAGRPTWLVGHGWIYPTDSSINMAIGQGHAVRPHGLSLEALDDSGRWVVVEPDLGFPAGKNKTVLIDLGALARAGVPDARRVRLRTNLEIYWDALAVAAGVEDAPLETTHLAPSVADLRYRGFSVTRHDDREEPEIPTYNRVETTMPRWRDLVGFYTRFGDVRELLAGVEDRYVIMNAGDELRLSFPAPSAPADGWTRDFVLVGDGWVKDGDFNTSFSKTVLPLPAHGRPDYDGVPGVTGPSLVDDPVYQRYRDDWLTYHTRFVTPDVFLAGLRPGGGEVTR